MLLSISKLALVMADLFLKNFIAHFSFESDLVTIHLFLFQSYSYQELNLLDFYTYINIFLYHMSYCYESLNSVFHD